MNSDDPRMIKAREIALKVINSGLQGTVHLPTLEFLIAAALPKEPTEEQILQAAKEFWLSTSYEKEDKSLEIGFEWGVYWLQKFQRGE